MRKWVFPLLIFWMLFEIAKIYFIMPFPGSQHNDTVALAYALHQYRWFIRAVIIVLMLLGMRNGLPKPKWLFILILLFQGVILYFVHYELSAEAMFLQTKNLVMAKVEHNKVELSRKVIAFEHQGEAVAYPMQYIAYHHQVIDTVGGEVCMITYCSVCRTGRVFIPQINGKNTSFRLVGMDSYNAMFEDEETGSWWRQATGECVAGKHKGKKLQELFIEQMDLGAWLAMHPNSKIMQPDTLFKKSYRALSAYDSGLSKGSLTRTDTGSWNEKSWVVGVILPNGKAKAYDWKETQRQPYILDMVQKDTVLVMIDPLSGRFGAWNISKTGVLNKKEWEKASTFSARIMLIPEIQKRRLKCYQEFWHSWRTFRGSEAYKKRT